MRPRSKLLSKRRLLLPTIREGAEETLRDFNEANSLHSHRPTVSSEDYLLSICHLAHPTFATRDVSFNNIHTKQQEAVQQRLQLPRHSNTPLPFHLKEGGGLSTNVQHREGRELKGRLIFNHSDPLEYLYGHHSDASGLLGSAGKAFEEGSLGKQRGRSLSIPRASSPNFLSQRKSSCPQLHTEGTNTISKVSSVNRLEVRRVCPADKDNPAIKKSLISHWISECRSAWREAQGQACMLPAIAEI